MGDEPQIQAEEEQGAALVPRGLGGIASHILPLAVYAAAIFYMGGGSAPALPAPPIMGIDKVVHFGAFVLFALLTYRASAYQWPNWERVDHRRLAVIGASAVGGVLELYQLGFPNRSCDIWDFVADSLGSLVGGWVMWAWSRRGVPVHPVD